MSPQHTKILIVRLLPMNVPIVVVSVVQSTWKRRHFQMSLSLLEKFISDDFGYSYTGKWGKASRHDSLVVNRETGDWFWNSKDLRGKVREYLLLVRNYSLEQTNELLKQDHKSESFSASSDSPSTPYEKLVNYCWQEGKDKRDYWYRRGLNDSTIDRFKLGYFNEWFVLPIFLEGEFRNFQCRKDTPDKVIRPWYRGVGPLLYNADILKFVSSVFITEGPVDAIKLNQEGFTAVSHTSGATGWKQDWF